MTLMAQSCYFSPKKTITTLKAFTTAIFSGKLIGNLPAAIKV